MGWELKSGRVLRRKQVDSAQKKSQGNELAKHLSVFQLIPIGVGTTLGAGIYVLVGTVAREHSGPSLPFSFLIAGIAAALSAFCYAELTSRCPSAGSAYHYSYICLGEGIAWLIGWALILEYTVGAATVARGISPNLAIFFGGEEKLPAFLVRVQVPGTQIVVDPCAAILVIIVTGLLCAGIKESAMVQAMVTSANVCVLGFVIVVGCVIGFQSGWPGYRLQDGYLPFGINGMLGGAATVFFAYIGFDSVASAAEEAKHPQRDLPLGIGIALLTCSCLYMLVSAVIVGVLPYYAMDPDTPISSAFAQHGMPWAMYLVTAGALAALSSSLMGSMLPQDCLECLHQTQVGPTMFYYTFCVVKDPVLHTRMKNAKLKNHYSQRLLQPHEYHCKIEEQAKDIIFKTFPRMKCCKFKGCQIYVVGGKLNNTNRCSVVVGQGRSLIESVSTLNIIGDVRNNV